MAAAEYYSMGTGAQELAGSHQHPPQPQFQQPPPQQYPQPHLNALPPAYSPFPNQPQQQQQQQMQAYPPPPQQQPQRPYLNNGRPLSAGLPYPTGTAQFQGAPQQSNSYLGAPLHAQRSYSQPARVRFADRDTSDVDSDSYSDSDNSSRRRHHHRRHHSRDRDLDDADRSPGHHHHHHSSTKIQRKEHKNRDTFLGAGVGGVIGDVIFPGLGTAAGLLIGGLGGRKYASRSKSEEGHRHQHHDASHEREEEAHADRDGYGHRRSRDYDDSDSSEDDRHRRRRGEDKHWDRKTATYRSGLIVR
jgi:hypothetical protein